MLNNEELCLVYERAYIPEHLPHYVEAVSSAESHLHDDYICFTRGTHLIFIGYPLKVRACQIEESFESACESFNPATVAIIAPRLWSLDQSYESQSTDTYYKLTLPLRPLDPELSYMVRRASRELRVTEGSFGRVHRSLVKEFIADHELALEHKQIFERIPHYLKRSKTARLLEARKGDKLEAFTIVDLGSADYAFYLFNFRSLEENIPGASDLLFYEMVRLAQSDNKKAINLGLGIHLGVRRFKEKWGGTPFLPYASTLSKRRKLNMAALVNKL
jgi:hypothetical protein